MARDAISRQYDVEKNSMIYTCEGEKGSYRPGVITFFPKKGKTLDIDKIRESINATRLSGGTGMKVDYFEITALGDVTFGPGEPMLKVSGTEQQFILGEDPTAKGSLQKLRDAVQRGDKIASVSGRLPGWNGVFPAVLRALAKDQSPPRLLLTGFEVSKK